MDNLFLQFESYKHELFALNISTIRCISKTKLGTRIFVEDYDFYDVLNKYKVVLQLFVDNNINVISVPVTQENKKT